MDVDLGKPIAYGRTAEIYAWQEGQVLKLFYDWYGLESIEYEARIARVVHDSGVPAPAAGEILRINDRYGLPFQRINGMPMNEVMEHKPWRSSHYAQKMAELHGKLHANPVQVDIPRQRQRLVDKINAAKALPQALKSKALLALEAMPDGDRLCHGDFHPGNILVTPYEEMIIDWTDVTRGNPLADLARTTILFCGSAETSHSRYSLIRAFALKIHNDYIRHYFRLRPGGEEEYRRWLPIVAAARLSENIPELEKWLISQAERGL